MSDLALDSKRRQIYSLAGHLINPPSPLEPIRRDKVGAEFAEVNEDRVAGDAARTMPPLNLGFVAKTTVLSRNRQPSVGESRGLR